ncbi:MAG: hypothetical protein A2X82_10955 [Geobacteraceae bacterium GWC2_55_20]|nr:MAG: hypothetical protein A2X82_10955 [Geobacteraceae bacterium GWC2_55_20]OGU25886.1 MAG: hypothetical protein A2X85_09165 [Geobacteraceae bacterium GWF2_54_21]HCE67261.1 hypothetical protein [Geobacter sp.]
MEKNIQELLRKTLLRRSDDALESDVANYSSLYGDIVYLEIMRLLTGKSPGLSESKRYWCDALALRDGILQKTHYRLSMRASILELIQKNSSDFKNLVFIEAKDLDSIRHCSVTDGLTGLYNQTYLKTLLGQNVPMRRRIDDSASALILLDLDYFKIYNDCCGHVAGDEALRTVAGIIKDQIREQDIAARYGGDEFAVYLPKVTKNVAFAVANRIRLAVENTVFPGQELLKGRKLTASCGISFYSEETSDVKSLIEVADRELYNAKRLRNSISPCSFERRKHQRHPTQALLQCFPANNGMSETAMACNFSNTGVGIWSNIPAEPEDSLTIRLSKPFWSDELEISGFVRQVSPDKDTGLRYLGIEFDRFLDDCTSYIPMSLAKSVMTH